jgi:hypothetical protein
VKLLPKLTIISTFILSLGVAQAQDNQPEKFYGGLEVGRANVSNDTETITSGLVSKLGGSASATQSTSISQYSIFGGYKLNENVSFVLGEGLQNPRRSSS